MVFGIFWLNYMVKGFVSYGLANLFYYANIQNMIKDSDFLTKKQNIIEKREVLMQTTEVVYSYAPQYLSAILEIDKKSFEKQYDDADKYYREALENPENINVFLKEGGELVGYLLAIPHKQAYEDLKKDDPKMPKDSSRFYVETIEVLPNHRIGKGAFKMILAMIDEAGKRGTNKFSMHIRVENGLSRLVQKYFGRMITEVRKIENWPYYSNGESTEYVEGTYEKK